MSLPSSLYDAPVSYGCSLNSSFLCNSQLPAMFMTENPKLQIFNLMQLHNPETDILSTLIFNAIIIPALIPLSLRGVKFKLEPPQKTFLRNMLIYGIGGAVLPFIGIKAINMLLSVFIR